MIGNFFVCFDFYQKHSNKKAVQSFYKRQNYLETCQQEDQATLERNEQEHREEQQNQQDADARWDDIITKITIGTNIIMIAAKIAAAILSHSFAILSTLVDSAMDITSGLIIWGTLRAMDKTNPYDYPIGQSRLEPLMAVIVAMIFIFANFMVIYEATMGIIQDTVNPIVDLETLLIIVIGSTIKLIIYFFCRGRKSPTSQVLAQDQFVDICTNIVALTSAFIGEKLWIYIDPIGAFLVSGYVIFNWFSLAKKQVPLLVGKTATSEYIHRITNIALSHDDRILALDTVVAYHLGTNYLVEIHVMMDKDLSLEKTHDISAGLQKKVERLPYVEQCFVHCDYENDGSEHFKKLN